MTQALSVGSQITTPRSPLPDGNGKVRVASPRYAMRFLAAGGSAADARRAQAGLTEPCGHCYPAGALPSAVAGGLPRKF
jgi:hypothetical protein